MSTGDETPVHFRALWGLGAFHFVRGEQRQARQVAEHCLLVAGQGSDDDAIMEAHYLSGITACVMGEFAAGQSELEECVRIYGTGKREAHQGSLRPGRQGIRVGVACHGTLDLRAS